MKTCTKCGESKPATTEFWYKLRGGLRSDCKVCVIEQSRLWHVANREAHCDQMRLYYEANREAEHDRSRLYYEANREAVRERQRLYHEKKRLELLASFKSKS